MNVLFVCTGNTCRSPMAEALLKHHSDGKVNGRSAGLFAAERSPIHKNAAIVLKNRDIQMIHKSKSLTDKLIEWSDVILTMTESHKSQLLQQFPGGMDKVYTLKEYVDIDQVDDQAWETLQKAIADLEAKRARFLQELQHPELSEKEIKQREQEMHNELTNDLRDVHALEKELPSRDIHDPYGASEEVYEEVCREIEDYIRRMLRKFE